MEPEWRYINDSASDDAETQTRHQRMRDLDLTAFVECAESLRRQLDLRNTALYILEPDDATRYDVFASQFTDGMLLLQIRMSNGWHTLPMEPGHVDPCRSWYVSARESASPWTIDVLLELGAQLLYKLQTARV